MRHGSVRDWLDNEYKRGRAEEKAERHKAIAAALELPHDEFLDFLQKLTGRDPRGDEG